MIRQYKVGGSHNWESIGNLNFRNSRVAGSHEVHPTCVSCMPDSLTMAMYTCQYHSNPFRLNRSERRPNRLIYSTLHAMWSMPFLHVCVCAQRTRTQTRENKEKKEQKYNQIQHEQIKATHTRTKQQTCQQHFVVVPNTHNILLSSNTLYSPKPNLAYFFICHSSFSNGNSSWPLLPNSSILWINELW